MKKFFHCTLLIALCSLLFTGCGGSDSAGDGKLSVMLGSNVVSLDTAQATDVASFEVIADCIDGLMQLDADRQDLYFPPARRQMGERRRRDR